jgi:GNAT superfamily N-acetyltransferase
VSDVAENVEIRRLRDDDSLAELTDLLHRSYARLAAMGLFFLATRQGVDVTARRIRKGECYVGVTEGRLVATVTFRPAGTTRDSPWLDRPDVCSFQQFAVDPPLQGRGIGRRLIAVCERRAVETGAAELALDTAEPAAHLIRLYERLGFRFIEYVRWPDVNYRSVIMSKTVRPADVARPA